MTTLIAKDNCIYADSGMTKGNVVAAVTPLKIGTLRHPTHGEMLYGFSGDFDIKPIMIEHIEKKTKMPKTQGFSGTIMAIAKNGKVYEWIDDFTETDGVDMGYSSCCGSGADVARGALAAGASPLDAMKIACSLDVWSRPPIVWAHVQDPEKHKYYAAPQL